MNDLIEWKLVAKDENNTNIYSYFNVNQVETKGLEFNSTYTKANNWEIKFGYQLLYAYDTEVLKRLEKILIIMLEIQKRLQVSSLIKKTTLDCLIDPDIWGILNLIIILMIKQR